MNIIFLFLSLSLSLSLSHTHTHPLSLSLSHTHALSLIISLIISLSSYFLSFIPFFFFSLYWSQKHCRRSLSWTDWPTHSWLKYRNVLKYYHILEVSTNEKMLMFYALKLFFTSWMTIHTLLFVIWQLFMIFLFEFNWISFYVTVIFFSNFS